MHKYVPKRFRQYETIVMFAPSINQLTFENVVKKIQEMLEKQGGKFTKVSLWGLRKMAYRIKKQDKAIYYQLNYVAPQGFVEEMERYLRVNEPVLRYLTVKMSEEPVDPSKVIVKSSDVVFASIEGISEAQPLGAAPKEIEKIEEEEGEFEAEGREDSDFAEAEVGEGEAQVGADTPEEKENDREGE